MIYLKDIVPAAQNNIHARFILLDKGRFSREGETKTCLALVADETAAVHFLLWGVESDAFQTGDIIQLSNGIFSYQRNNLVLRAGKRGTIEKIGEFTLPYVETPNMSEISWLPDPSNPQKYVAGKMGGRVSEQIEKRKSLSVEKKALLDLKQSCGCDYPGCDYCPSDRKNWMAGLDLGKLTINKIVWPGTHDSATNKIGIPLITRPFAQCQSLSIYDQLVRGTRLLDIRVQEDRRVCHGILKTYGVDVVIEDVKKFLSETTSEIIILEIRTEFGHEDPPEFDKYLVEKLGDYLIHQDDHVFGKTVAELLPKRVICIWKPRKSAAIKAGSPLWSAGYLRDNWIDTDLPSTKFESNLKHLSEQPPVSSRKYFYPVENTVTPQADNPVLSVKPVTNRIHGYSRLFMAQCFSRGIADRLQVFSTVFIDGDFVDACVALTNARIEGKV